MKKSVADKMLVKEIYSDGLWTSGPRPQLMSRGYLINSKRNAKVSLGYHQNNIDNKVEFEISEYENVKVNDSILVWFNPLSEKCRLRRENQSINLLIKSKIISATTYIFLYVIFFIVVFKLSKKYPNH